IQLAFAHVAMAGRYYDDAKRLVTQQQLQLESKAQTLLLNAISLLANQLFMGSHPLLASLEVMNDLEKTIAELSFGFRQIAELDAAEISKTKELIRQHINNFGNLNREFFAYTFAPTSIERQRGGFVALFERFVDSYSYMCEKGRGDLDWIEKIPPNLKPDSVKFNLYFEI